MTDQPKTLALDTSEWKALLLSNLARAHEFVNGRQAPNADAAAALFNHLDHIKSLVAAWQASQAPVEPPAVGEPKGVQGAANANGADAPSKRKGGWPAGKPRKKRNAPAQAVQ